MASVNNQGRLFTIVGPYYVIKDSEHMTGIYLDYGKRLITSRPKWSQAIKLAVLLNDAYEEGIESTTRYHWDD